ncbi:sulfatase family protein [Algisphaera agarilytica]|uniref:Arylsulfatase A-like enzyme n=1 Tax=Algisphaera agarilytica TaxID=1385975 RepID=A0A7X0LJB9_9BACT|nr:sulfatase [Algisphaera agarilytica]MBB6429165.1 arylsulfatase A-like enzyme [Algisphaera agarilytica]
MTRILYLDLDALNPTHLGCYGYHRNTSPNIDAIAQQGIRFDNVYCSDAPCLPSRTALYQCRFGIRTGVVGHGGTAADPKRQGETRGFRSVLEEHSFPRMLQKRGYHTAMISPFGQRHAAHQYYAGFNEMHNTGEGGQEPVETVQPVVERWLDAHAAEPSWYLHLNYWDIHTPYRTPLDYGNPFDDVPIADWYTDELIAEHVARGGPHSAQDLDMYHDADSDRYPRLPRRITDRASLKQWIDGYDVAIRYVDEAVGKLVDQLKRAGVYDDTAIIISADHGENQGELEIYGEHGTADHATCHIPFILKWPGGQAGATDDGLHYHLDWPATCLELLGESDEHEPTPAGWDGRSFTPTVTEGKAQGRDELVLSQCAHVCQRSVRFDEGDHRWLYIRTYHDGFHPFPDHMLFDLASDPQEQHNLADAHPEVLREANWRLSGWHDEAMSKIARDSADVTDPMRTVLREGGPYHACSYIHGRRSEELTRYLQKLRDSGRAAAAENLERRYPLVKGA